MAAQNGALAGLSIAIAEGSISNNDFFKLIKQHGATPAFLLTKKTHFLVASPEQAAANSFKVKTAFDYGVKVVTEEYITKCIGAGKPLDPTPFLITPNKSKPKQDMFAYEKEFVSEVELQKQKEMEKKAAEDKQRRLEMAEKASAVTARQPRKVPTGPVKSVRVVKVGDPAEPKFPEDFELIYYRTLQWTDVQANHNKYYAIEFHKAEENGKSLYRLYTHYGRTDDLATNPKAGRRECRYYDNENDAENGFAAIVQEKTGAKGYRPVDLVFSNIGSSALKKLGEAFHSKPEVSSAPSQEVPSNLDASTQELIRYLYEEATSALSNSIGPTRITSKGIETPLGVVTLTQIEKGERILKALYDIFQVGRIQQEQAKMASLSNEFYTAIPHSIGRSKSSVQSAVLQSMADFQQKEELLQLMRDMLAVSVETQGGKTSDLDMQYAALKNSIHPLPPHSSSSSKPALRISEGSIALPGGSSNSSRKRSNSDVLRKTSVRLGKGYEEEEEEEEEKKKEKEQEEEKKEEKKLQLGTSGPQGAPKSIRTAIGPYNFEKIRLNIGRENLLLKKSEDKLRLLFVEDKNNFRLNDPYLHLIEVFKRRDDFRFLPDTTDDEKIPKLLTKLRIPGKEDHSVVRKEEFLDGFHEFTGGIFKGMDWKNVFVAGGSVLAPLLNIPDDQREKSFKDSDIDLFLYGLNQEEANAKIEEIFFCVQSNTNASGEIVRTSHAVTILNTFPIRHVQIILRLYKSPAEILLGFDVDCCAVGFDGTSAWALPRAQRALVKRYNLVDMSRRSLTYESRLYKYAKRGFAVGVPGLLRHLVRPDLYQKRPAQVKGLAKLLLFEHALTNPDGRYDAWKPKGHRLSAYSCDDYSEDRIHEFLQIDQISPQKASDYSNLYFPWGPQWHTSQVVKDLLHRDKSQFMNTKNHVVLIGIDSVFSGNSSWVKTKEEQQETQHSPNLEVEPTPSVDKSKFVIGPIQEAWLLENPGRQLLTGSFHPITDDQWYDDAYVSVTAEEDFIQTLCDASFGSRLNVLRTLLRKNRLAKVNAPDSFFRLPPLHLACLFGYEEIARELIDAGSDVSALDERSGLRPLHFASYSGKSRLVDFLIRRQADLNSTTLHQRWTPLHFAAYYGYGEVVKTLLDSSRVDRSPLDIKGRSPLYLAAMGGHVDVLRRLVDSGCSCSSPAFDGSSPLDAALLRGRTTAVAFLAKKLGIPTSSLNGKLKMPPSPLPCSDSGPPDGPKLLKAAALGNEEEVQKELTVQPGDLFSSPGHIFDSTRTSSLHISSVRSPHLIKVLVEKSRPTLLNYKDMKGQTPLHLAVRHANLSSVQFLLRYISKNQRSLLATSQERVDTFPLEVDAENEMGQTPLFYCMQLLASLNRDPSSSSDGLLGLPPSDEKRNLEQIRNLLLDAGAAKPHLNFYSSLPSPPSSSYLATYSSTLHPSSQNAPSSSLESAISAESAYLEAKRLDNERFDFLNRKEGGGGRDTPTAPEAANQNSFDSPYHGDLSHKRHRLGLSQDVPTDLPPTSKRVRFEEDLPQPSSSSSSSAYTAPSSAPFEIGSSSSPSKSHRPYSSSSYSSGYSSVTSDLFSSSSSSSSSQISSSLFSSSVSNVGSSFAPSSSYSASSSSPSIESANLPDFNSSNPETSNRFSLPPPSSSTSLPRDTRKIPLMAERVASFGKQSNTHSYGVPQEVPMSRFSRLLLQINRLAKEGKITPTEKAALKTLAVLQNPSLIAAMVVFDVDKDDAEFLDTLKKISHCAHVN